MQLGKLLLLGLLSIILLSGCSLLNSEQSMMNKMSPTPKVENQFTPSIIWSTPVGSGVGNFYSNLHPAFADNMVYAADRKGTVKALNAENGKEVWSVNLAEKNGWFSHPPSLLSGGLTISGEHLYVGSEKARLYALNNKDGSIAWETHIAGEAVSHPVVSDGIVLIHTSNGQLQALNESNGTSKWMVNLDIPLLSLRGESSPTVAYGAAIVGSDNGRVSAVLMQQGQIIWQQRVAQATGTSEIARLNDIDTTPVVLGDVVYTLGYNGSNLTALDLRSGQILWKRGFGSVHDFIIDVDRIYLVDQHDRLLALSSDGNVTLWTQDNLLHHLLTAPVLYSGYLIVGDSTGRIYWINPQDGGFVAMQEVDSSGFQTNPVVAGGRLLIQANNGMLYSIARE